MYKNTEINKITGKVEKQLVTVIGNVQKARKPSPQKPKEQSNFSMPCFNVNKHCSC